MRIIDWSSDVCSSALRIAEHKVALKGPLTTPIGGGFTSVNVTLRRHFDLYANVRPAVSFPGTKSRYENIDIITVRENTEGAYRSEGQTLSADGEIAESVARNTRRGSSRIVRYAFELAVKKEIGSASCRERVCQYV